MKERRDSWTPQELLDKVVKLDRDEYKVDEILDETYLDLDQIVDFLEETQKFDAKHDDKLQKLIRLLNSKDLEKRKVLIFSEFSDTAQYIAKHLGEAGIEGLEQLDSSSGKNRADVIRRFSPYYNGSSSEELAASRDTDATCDGFETAPQALHLRRAPDRPRREVERLGDPLGEGEFNGLRCALPLEHSPLADEFLEVEPDVDREGVIVGRCEHDSIVPTVTAIAVALRLVAVPIGNAVA